LLLGLLACNLDRIGLLELAEPSKIVLERNGILHPVSAHVRVKLDSQAGIGLVDPDLIRLGVRMDDRSVARTDLVVVPTERFLVLPKLDPALYTGFRKRVHVPKLDFDRSYVTHDFPQNLVQILETFPNF
jgi:hypothetical protein